MPHVEQVLRGAVRVVETGPESTDNLVAVKAHLHQIRDSRLVPFATDERLFA